MTGQRTKRQTITMDKKCPFCKGNITAGYLVSHRSAVPESFVTHTFPTCETFEKTGRREFIVACRDLKEKL